MLTKHLVLPMSMFLCCWFQEVIKSSDFSRSYIMKKKLSSDINQSLKNFMLELLHPEMETPPQIKAELLSFHSSAQRKMLDFRVHFTFAFCTTFHPLHQHWSSLSPYDFSLFLVNIFFFLTSSLHFTEVLDIN